MVRLKVRLSSKGQIVIPKVIRESIGLEEKSDAIMEVKGNTIEIRAFPDEDIVQKARERAKKHGGNVTNWVYGDRLYEEVF